MCHQCAHSYHTPIAMIPDPPMLSAPPPPPNNHPKHKRVNRKCSHQYCDNRVVQGGVCVTHGTRRKCCAHPGCEKFVRNSGYCSAHGPSRQTSTTLTRAALFAESADRPHEDNIAPSAHPNDDAHREGSGEDGDRDATGIVRERAETDSKPTTHAPTMATTKTTTTGMTGAHTPTTTTTTGKAVQRARSKAAMSAASREDPALVSYDGDDANNDGDGNHGNGRLLNHSANVGQLPSTADDARRIHGPTSTSTTSSSSTSAVVVVHKDWNKGYPRGAYVGGGGGGSGSDDAWSGYNSSSSGGNSHGKHGGGGGGGSGGHQHHNSKKKTDLSAHAVEYLKNWMMSPPWTCDCGEQIATVKARCGKCRRLR